MSGLICNSPPHIVWGLLHHCACLARDFGVIGLSFHHAQSAAPTLKSSATSWFTVSSAIGMVSPPDMTSAALGD